MVGLGISVEATIIGHVPEAMIADHERDCAEATTYTEASSQGCPACAACRRVQKMSKVEQERLEADKIKYALVSQRKAVEDELNKRDEYHMPDQEVGQTMSKKYELLTSTL